jgi:hypothetical protein
MKEPSGENYNIKTIQELYELVNSDNIEALRIDIALWMDMVVQSKVIAKATGGLITMRNTDTFHWVDDGAHNLNVNIQVEVEGNA